jgi:hypothetical protein
VAERSEAGWGLAQRVVDQREHSFQIAIDFIVPEAQYPESVIGKVIVALRIASGKRIEVMLTTIDLDDEAVFETDEIYDITITRGLAAEVKSLSFP